MSSATSVTSAPSPPLAVGMIVFEGFELLDVFGPLEMFGMLREKVAITILAEHLGPVRSSAGPAVVAERTLAEPGRLDVLLVPGGMGTRREVTNVACLHSLRALAEVTPHVASICTGSALLARTGLLDQRRATTNKRSFRWATSQGPAVNWVAAARWVEDGKYFTSSGVSAGMDMALGLIAKLFDRVTAEGVARGAEYEWNSDRDRDPFAKLNGLAP
jgi:transcriptional regulator GlxA family with amidase domain